MLKSGLPLDLYLANPHLALQTSWPGRLQSGAQSDEVITLALACPFVVSRQSLSNWRFLSHDYLPFTSKSNPNEFSIHLNSMNQDGFST
jgi:hypothetical protein